MTVKVNGSPKAGVWFERDISVLNVNIVEELDFGVDANVETTIRVITTRGTILAMNEGATTSDLVIVLGHAAGAFTDLSAETPTSVLAELQAELVKVFPGAVITLGDGFLAKV